MRDLLEGLPLDDSGDGGGQRGIGIAGPSSSVASQQRSSGSGSAATEGPSAVAGAAKPMFEVHVGDPHKVGDLTTAHTVYNVRTKVGPTPLALPPFFSLLFFSFLVPVANQERV